MKTTLIFPPFVTPSYIPLGIAQLKSYVQSRLPSVKVRTIDLNNRFLNNICRKESVGLGKKICSLCLRKDKRCAHVKNNPGLISICRFGINALRDREADDFYDPKRYNYFIKKISALFMSWNQCITLAAKNTLENGRALDKPLKDLIQCDLDTILETKPDLIGFSMFASSQLAYSLLLAQALKGMTEAPIIFGGAFMSYLDIPSLLTMFDCVDFAMNGEGEIGLAELARNLKNNNFGTVPGLSYRADGMVRENSGRFIEDLDNLPPPDFGDFHLGHYLSRDTVLPVIFSRGCFWGKCAFCTYHKTHPAPYKTKSVKKIMGELKYYVSKGIRHFFIDDDAAQAATLKKVSLAIIKEKINVFFGAIVRPDKDFSPQTLASMYSAGGRVLVWGVESGCQRLLDLMNKGTRVTDIRRILRDSTLAGFYNHVFMIRGFPTQTEEEICDDMRFLTDNRRYIDSFFIHDFGLSKDSYIYCNPDTFKIGGFRRRAVYRHRINSAVLYGNAVSFTRGRKLDWQRIGAAQKRILCIGQRHPKTRFHYFEHGHALLHTSRTSPGHHKKIMYG